MASKTSAANPTSQSANGASSAVTSIDRCSISTAQVALQAQQRKSKGKGRLGPLIGYPTPPPRSLIPTKDAGDLVGGFRVADWRPQPQINRGLLRSPRSIRVWRQQSVTPTLSPRSPVPTGDADDLDGGVGVAD
ncbi:hypothetical protein CRG98_012612 [Punica granatum]|uniref:Uncharacterized protein n=1 Tax=Punica granatum TaxID=22663 RepID=A0A2I0KFN8_PUNGR|nr:hypothetical protein CRG98_012612 [Punica granatum]